MTGSRVGYAIGDSELIQYVQNAHIVLSYTTAGPAQMAAAVGLELAESNGFWEEHRRDLKRKLDGLCETFERLGLPVGSLNFFQSRQLVVERCKRSGLTLWCLLST